MLAKGLRRHSSGWSTGYGDRRPDLALQAAMEGYEVVTMEHAAPKADIRYTTGNQDVITIDHMRKTKIEPLSVILAILTMKLGGRAE